LLSPSDASNLAETALAAVLPRLAEWRRIAIPSVLVNGHLLLGMPADKVTTYRVQADRAESRINFEAQQ
jgi:hypothetical protein